jgi:hypothetical protein|tara:strand:- start:262 stop:525 length:264 start_codon:yes stop_codon:yes gene_type:complete
MSDSIKKYFELQEDGKIFESPDGGDTIYRREMGKDHSSRKLIQSYTEYTELQLVETVANIARKYPDMPPELLRALAIGELKLKEVCD